MVRAAMRAVAPLVFKGLTSSSGCEINADKRISSRCIQKAGSLKLGGIRKMDPKARLNSIDTPKTILLKIPKKNKAVSADVSSAPAKMSDSSLAPKAMVDEEIKMVGDIYRHFKRCAGGADGAVVGLNGSIRATCLVRMLRALQVNGREVVDFGAGDGRVLLAALSGGASKASGYELPENEAHRFVFDAVRNALLAADAAASPRPAAGAWPRANWVARDINSVREIPSSASCVYSFWVGMPLPTQEHILALCARSPSVDSVAVFRDRKWRKPEEGAHAPSPRSIATPI